MTCHTDFQITIFILFCAHPNAADVSLCKLMYDESSHRRDLHGHLAESPMNVRMRHRPAQLCGIQEGSSTTNVPPERRGHSNEGYSNRASESHHLDALALAICS